MLQIYKRKMGPVEQKILVLLAAGILLTLTRSPKGYSKIIHATMHEWKKINRKSLYAAIQRLYQSKMIAYKENADDTISITLQDTGRQRALTYNLENILLAKKNKWDRQWRIVMFDIPEHLKSGRDALAAKLKAIGMHTLQKSVFIYPHECKNEIEFIAEIFQVRPYVRLLTTTTIDNELHLKRHFGI